MKKLTLIIIFILTILFSHGQKKELFVNDDFENISKFEFDKKSNNPLDYNLRFDLDSCFLNVKVLRYKEDKIDIKLLNKIKTTLSTTSQLEIKSDDILIINYYPGNDPCSTTGYKENFKNMYKKYHRKIDKLKNVKQFFIYKSKDNIDKFGSKINWLLDENNLIENTFYPINYPCGGYVIIDKKGNYTSQRGEYCYSYSLIKKLKDIANNGYM